MLLYQDLYKKGTIFLPCLVSAPWQRRCERDTLLSLFL